MKTESFVEMLTEEQREELVRVRAALMRLAQAEIKPKPEPRELGYANGQ